MSEFIFQVVNVPIAKGILYSIYTFPPYFDSNITHMLIKSLLPLSMVKQMLLKLKWILGLAKPSPPLLSEQTSKLRDNSS